MRILNSDLGYEGDAASPEQLPGCKIGRLEFHNLLVYLQSESASLIVLYYRCSTSAWPSIAEIQDSLPHCVPFITNRLKLK